jgi:transcriptional regulator with XRE-family HTH domain
VDTDDDREAFARRMHELCDELGIPRGHGRNAALGRKVGKTPNAARKWLLGLGYPELSHAVALCKEAQVNVNWLLQGAGPKKGERTDADTLRLAEGLERLPLENKQAVLEYLRYEFERADGWFTHEALARYIDSIDEIKRRAANTRGRPLTT